MDNLPLQFQVDDDSTFNPGQIGQLKVAGNEIVCGTSDGTAPFGIIDDVKTPTSNTTQFSKRVTIWISKGVFETDQFDTLQRYSIGKSLFVDQNGILTTKQNTESREVGICCIPPSAESPVLKFLWTGNR